MATLRFLADIDINSNKIQNLADGTSAGDAVNKGQLDGKLGTTLNSAQVFVGNASNVATAVTLSGDVSLSNAGVVTIANDAVTYAKMQNVSETSRLLGRVSTGAGDVEELTGTQATALLNNFTSTLKGLVPGSGGGTSNFLRADGTWSQVALGTNISGVLPVGNGGTGTGTALTQGSVVFAGAGGVLSQNNANFFWDNANSRLGIGINTFDTNEKLAIKQNSTVELALKSTSTTGRASVFLQNELGSGAKYLGLSLYASGGSTSNLLGVARNDRGYIISENHDIGIGSLTANFVFFGTSNTERMRITSTGNVGIGITSPTQPLHVNGNILIDGANQNRYIQTEGTQTATGRLIVQAGAQGANFGGAVNLFAHAHATKPGWVTVGLSSGASGKFTVNSQALGGGTDVFVVQDNGNVGIGETSPAVKFVSNGQSQINGVLSLKGNGNTAFSTGTASELRLWNDNSSKTFSLHHTNNSQFRILDPSTNLCWQITDGGKFVVNVADNDGTAFSASILGGGSTFLQMDSTNDNERLILGSVTTGAALKLQGGRHVDITTLTANFTLRKSDYVVEANATSGAFTITLPAAPVTGQVFYIVRINSGANNVTIDGNTKNINGSATLVLSNQFDTAQIVYNGTQWLKI